MVRDRFAKIEVFIEDCPSLSILDLQRAGGLKADSRRKLEWPLQFDGRTVTFVLSFAMGVTMGTLVTMIGDRELQYINLTLRRDTRGRNRWFFEENEETFQKAYLLGERFRSRKAHKLKYRAQHYGHHKRKLDSLWGASFDFEELDRARGLTPEEQVRAELNRRKIDQLDREKMGS